MVACAVAAHIVTHMLGGAAQGDFAQGNQIALAEKILGGPFGLLGQIDLAGLEALQQFVGGHVHQDQLIGIVQHGVGHRLVDADAGDGAHRAVEAFQVLHIERGPDVHAGAQQFLHILPALGVARARRVAVGQLVQQQHLRPGLEGRVDIKLPQHLAAVRHLPQRQLWQAFKQFPGFAPAMGLHQPDQHRLPCRLGTLGRLQHGKGLAHAGAGAKVDAQLAARHGRLVCAQLGQQGIGVGAEVGGGGHGVEDY